MKTKSQVLRSKTDFNAALIPKTWLDFFNGPDAGTINLESAKRDMPWLVSAKTILLRTGEARHHTANHSEDRAAAE